jgi:hypothetical protein
MITIIKTGKSGGNGDTIPVTGTTRGHLSVSSGQQVGVTYYEGGFS